MFEVGKRYRYKIIIDGEEASTGGIVERYEHPLLKFKDSDAGDFMPHMKGKITRGQIINVTSPNFISAVLAE